MCFQVNLTLQRPVEEKSFAVERTQPGTTEEHITERITVTRRFSTDLALIPGIPAHPVFPQQEERIVELYEETTSQQPGNDSHTATVTEYVTYEEIPTIEKEIVRRPSTSEVILHPAFPDLETNVLIKKRRETLTKLEESVIHKVSQAYF